MDDQVGAPDDPFKYTLAFGTDSRAAILADCNRGTGTWTSASAGQLRSGPIAATKALCPLRKQFTINFLSGYVDPTNHQMKAKRKGYTWTVTLDNGEVYEVPLAAIGGAEAIGRPAGTPFRVCPLRVGS